MNHDYTISVFDTMETQLWLYCETCKEGEVIEGGITFTDLLIRQAEHLSARRTQVHSEPPVEYVELTQEEIAERFRIRAICDRCDRNTCAEEMVGTIDQMTQPNGCPCGGTFISPETYERRRTARCQGIDTDGEQCKRFDLVCSRDSRQMHLRPDYREFPRSE